MKLEINMSGYAYIVDPFFAFSRLVSCLLVCSILDALPPLWSNRATHCGTNGQNAMCDSVRWTPLSTFNNNVDHQPSSRYAFLPSQGLMDVDYFPGLTVFKTKCPGHLTGFCCLTGRLEIIRIDNVVNHVVSEIGRNTADTPSSGKTLSTPTKCTHLLHCWTTQ